MVQLGVNIDHVATLRQARYRDASSLQPEPDLLAAAREAEAAGAHGITVHLREDRRHIQDGDVRQLRKSIATRLNLELANTTEIVAFAATLKPDEVCLVPENRREVSTEGGLDVRGAPRSLARSIARLRSAAIAVSLFVDPDDDQIRASADHGATHIELHTGRYANCVGRAATRELGNLKRCATLAHRLGLRVNAGHGLNYKNTRRILDLPHLETLNIGHAIVSRAVFVGLRRAVEEMLQIVADQ